MPTTLTKLAVNATFSQENFIQNVHCRSIIACCREDAAANNGCCTV